MNDVLTCKSVKTRKPHLCFGCGREFPKGTEMTFETVADAGTVSSFYICGTCWDVMDSMEPGDEFCFGDLLEDALELEEKRRSTL